jgi:phage FluMu protein Com
LIVVAAGATICLLPTAVQAQISPGPLSKAHASLDGAAHCTDCHQRGGEATLKCLDCHTEIASRLAAKRGLHAFYHVTAGLTQECARCHSEHNGRDFPLVKWDPKTFKHKDTGYVLEGRHAGLACSKCHMPEKISSVERSQIKMKDLSRTFLGLATECTSCHKDTHEGRLGQNCLQCHNYVDWKDVSGKFDHSKTRYPLAGLHQTVKCAKCHTNDAEGKPRYTGLPFGKCSDCHADPHKGSFAAQPCQSCHNTGGWKKVTGSTLSSNFDHTKTKYPLLGKHQSVDCLLCHANGDFKRSLKFAECADCHKDAHSGQFANRANGGECASCHTVDGWKPSLFDAKAHQQSAYPLAGKHATLECGKCHVPQGRQTLYKVKFAQCTDCHKDDHDAQFASAPYLNRCEQCHNLNGFVPSTFTLARHKQIRFTLNGGHLATPCADCHKLADASLSRSQVPYQWKDLNCESCHVDLHKGQFKQRMSQAGADGKALGCEACHSTKAWKDLTKFDHARTSFALVGAHRAVACIDCHKPSNLGTKLIDVDFRIAPTQCEQCHQDIHGAQFARAADHMTPCADCHTSMKWKPSLFDHDKRTAFPLQGFHRNVRCDGCHKLLKPVEGKTVLFYRPTAKECAACHGAEELKRQKGL